MKIVDLSQRSPDWLRWRAQGVTASEAAVVLGRSPYKTPWRLWAERTGLARAAKVGAWGQAEEYCRSRFNGAQLVFALAELGHAKEEAQTKKNQRQAA